VFQAVMQRRCPTAALRVRWQRYAAELVDSLFAESACVIFPSDKTPLHEAKCSVRLATTLLRGVPVVASAVGEQQQYGAAGAAELVVADAPPQVFAAAVAHVLAQPQARLLRQAHARARLLRDYSWEKLCDALAAFYRGQQQG
jgi:glycosyltransferase involved in cell wall biosynthesis